MKSFLLIVAALVVMTIRCHAQTPRDVPDVASHEIARRGSHVEETGTIRSGLMAAALAPPADDSGKWFLTLVVQPNHLPSDAMRSTFDRDPEMRRWVDTANPQQSFMHYQLRSVTDTKQRDWLEPVMGTIRTNGLPLVILQPPRNGQFGKSATIVKTIHGQMTGKELSDKLREAVLTYVQTIEKPAQVGINAPVIGVAPPFNPPAQAVAPPFDAAPLPPVNFNPGFNPGNPLPAEWPPSAPKALTIEQIKGACPDATPEFVLATIASKETNIDAVKLRWLIAQQQSKTQTPAVEVVPECPVNPCVPAPSMLSGVPLVWIGLAAAASLLFLMLAISGTVIYLMVKRSSAGGSVAAATAPLKPFDPTMYTQQPAMSASPSIAPTWKAPVSNGNGSA